MNVLVIGGNSGVAKALMLQLVSCEPVAFYVLVRDAEKFSDWMQENQLEHCVYAVAADVSNLAELTKALQQILRVQKNMDRVLIAYGLLPEQMLCETDNQALQDCFSVNALSVMQTLNYLLQAPLSKPCKIMVITSVAGQRGRPRNFAYGSAKAAVGVYLQGLRSVYYQTGWEFYEIKLGPVDTPMTANHTKNFSFSSPEKVAAIMLQTFGTKRYQRFVPGFWFWVIAAVKLMPEWLFQRLRFLSGR